MKKMLAVIFAVALLTGCAGKVVGDEEIAVTNQPAAETSSVVQSESISERVTYGDEGSLCADYLTAYFSALDGSAEFCPEQYADDEDMIAYAKLKQAYDRDKMQIAEIEEITVHIAKITGEEKGGGITAYNVPYEVSYRNNNSTDESGFGRSAYFEVISTDKGLRVYRAYEFTAADMYAGGFSEKDPYIDGFPLDCDIKEAAALLEKH